MPVLFIYGIPDNNFEDIGSLIVELKRAVCSISVLELKENDVSCFFPKDGRKIENMEEIIIFIKGLYDKPERTEEIRKKLAKKVCGTIDYFFEPYNKLIECFIEPFKVENGFYKWG